MFTNPGSGRKDFWGTFAGAALAFLAKRLRAVRRRVRWSHEARKHGGHVLSESKAPTHTSFGRFAHVSLFYLAAGASIVAHVFSSR